MGTTRIPPELRDLWDDGIAKTHKLFKLVLGVFGMIATALSLTLNPSEHPWVGYVAGLVIAAPFFVAYVTQHRRHRLEHDEVTPLKARISILDQALEQLGRQHVRGSPEALRFGIEALDGRISEIVRLEQALSPFHAKKFLRMTQPLDNEKESVTRFVVRDGLSKWARDTRDEAIDLFGQSIGGVLSDAPAVDGADTSKLLDDIRPRKEAVLTMRRRIAMDLERLRSKPTL